MNVEIKHGHLFCGLGGGAKGFNRGKARVGSMVGKFRCLGGIDVDPAAIRDFERMSGVAGTVMDLFDRDQYIAWHGHEPPQHWREATPADILRAMGNEIPDIWFLSAPCKGFSGLLSESKSGSLKYQALNRLTLRGIWLMLEAQKDDPAAFIVFENVPRIATRGRHLLDQIVALLKAYGYAVAETTHDCGELGGLAQSRKRFLLVARHVEKIPPFLYQPPKRPLRAVGDVLGKMPLPGDLSAGPMHRMPALQWKTWVRLAFVEAGSDWRSLNKLAVEDGFLRDFAIVSEPFERGPYGVLRWSDYSRAISADARPSKGRFAVADPRDEIFKNGYGIVGWAESVGAIAGQSYPSNGRFSVQDPRFDSKQYDCGQYGVVSWKEPAATIRTGRSPGQGGFAVDDPRFQWKNAHENKMRVADWAGHVRSITGSQQVGSGAQSVADPRIPSDGNQRFNNVFRIVRWDRCGQAVTSAASSMQCVADPRPPEGPQFSKYTVSRWGTHSGTVIAGAVNGAFAVADPRPKCIKVKGDDYLSGGHYGVVPWTTPGYAVTSHARWDNGWFSVADPRGLPAASERTVAVIQSLDGTWHRPFTTLELAALQSLIDPEEFLELEGLSDSAWRERIGNAVPPDAAEAIASVMGTTFLLARAGETFALSDQEIWVRPIAVALSVRPS